METLKFRITSQSPLLMHNGDLADYRYKWTKELKKISGKRGKTEDDMEEMARLEWCGGLYLKDGALCIPALVIEAAITGKGGPARKMKMGAAAAAGVFVAKDALLEYDGPRVIEELWKDERFQFRCRVNVQGSRIIRTRPIFHQWAAMVEVQYRPDMVDRETIVAWMGTLGSDVGLGDWRPKFGRFTVKVL